MVQLVERWHAGDDREEVFRTLFETFYGPLYRFFTRRGFSPEESQDLIQETFLRVYKGIASFRQEAKWENWLFQIASNTKPFTAAALGTLVEAGTLAWDTPILTYLPEFALADPYPTTWVTPRDMLTMRSGLPAFGGDLLGDFGYPRPEILHQVRRITPGASFRAWAYYSNIGYFIAGMVGETPENWRRCVEKTIQLAPESVTIYQMELPFNTVFSKELNAIGQDDPGKWTIADWPTKRHWVDEAFTALAARFLGPSLDGVRPVQRHAGSRT